MYKVPAAIAALILLEELAEFIYRRTDSYKKRSLSGFSHLYAKIPGDLEIVNIGSGPGLYGIGYEYCKRKGYNLSTAPQNFKNGFRILKRFSHKLNFMQLLS